MIRLRHASISAAFVILAAACGGSGSGGSRTTETTEAPAPVGGLLATIGTDRLYALKRGFGLGLRNVGDAPVSVRQVQLDSPLFETMPLLDEGALLQPGGRRFVLRLPYGAARCDGHVDQTFAAVVVLDDGETLRLPAVEVQPGDIGRIHERECAAADVHERVDFGFGDQWTKDGNTISGELVLELRRSGEPVTFDGVRGNVIFTIKPQGDEPMRLEVSDDEPRFVLPVVITAARCDSHVLAEAKRPHAFLTWITVGDGEQVPIEFEATGAARAGLDELRATCHS